MDLPLPGRLTPTSSPPVRWFLLPTLLAAIAIAAATAAGAPATPCDGASRRGRRETRGRRLAAWSIALAVLAMTLLPAIATDSSLLLGHDWQ